MERLIAKTPVDFNCLGKDSTHRGMCLPYTEQPFALCVHKQGSQADFFSNIEQYYSSPHWSLAQSPLKLLSFFFSFSPSPPWEEGNVGL